MPQAPPPGHVSLVTTSGTVDRGAGLLPAPPLSDGVVPATAPPTTVVSFTPLQPTVTSSRSTGLLSTPVEVTMQQRLTIAQRYSLQPARTRPSRFDLPYQPAQTIAPTAPLPPQAPAPPLQPAVNKIEVRKCLRRTSAIDETNTQEPKKEESSEKPTFDIGEMLRRIRTKGPEETEMKPTIATEQKPAPVPNMVISLNVRLHE